MQMSDEEAQAVMAVGRLLRMGARPTQPGDMRPEEALAWLEKVGCWPSDDTEVQRRTAEAERVLRTARHR